MSSQEFQQLYQNVDKTGKRLFQFLQEVRSGFAIEGQNVLRSTEEDLQKTLQDLSDQKYKVAVVAPMKAGKSTFLNSVIGADILASENAACTICTTEIRHIDETQTPRLVEYREGARKPILLAEGNATKIQQQFLERTRQIRKMGNCDRVIRFEVDHPIEAISQLPSLSGFTLIDTPGPNEWKSFNELDQVSLKEITLKTLRTCNVVVFVLDYTSYKDHAIIDLFQEVLNNRPEILNKVYFVLNKIDLKSERDPEIDTVVDYLKNEFIEFGFANPMVFPASSRKGLLAKLIINGTATKADIEDFENFFTAPYRIKDEQGQTIIPAPDKIAPQALLDSEIPKIEEKLIQTITQNAGVNLLEDVLVRFDKTGKGIEDSLNTKIQGLTMGLEDLKQKVNEYAGKADSANQQILTLKKSIKNRESELIERYDNGLQQFATQAKTNIRQEIEQLAESLVSRSKQSSGGLIDGIFKVFNNFFDRINVSENQKYKIRLNNKNDAQQILKAVNDYCAPHLQDLWVKTQDSMIREGTQIRQELADEIQNKMQSISDELSQYLGQSLDIKLNVDPILIPELNFEGVIDEKVDRILSEIQIVDKEVKHRSCRDPEIIDVFQVVHEIDLVYICELIQKSIDEQIQNSKVVIDRVINKQVNADFSAAAKQIEDYIENFQLELESLVWQQESQGDEAQKMLIPLEQQKVTLNQLYAELRYLEDGLSQLKSASRKTSPNVSNAPPKVSEKYRVECL
ncbi:dynamin family protein [Lyngbya sp. CCY1209]|uniref:dynamin family protein n=1 Tax=Lyngbya sp. CCY1209 TaxID=2886103 RepID=UPI002D200A43|nr:dynamin family protein [Lyngbya sp. CCY1209]MEB3883170.1 dynamin family protein [Lyngbya sp. CCY1209]